MRPALFLLTLLALSSPALACSVKSGFVANGLFKNTAGLASTCGPLYQTFKHKFETSKWTELYLLGLSQDTQKQVEAVLGSLRANDYRKVREQVTGRSQIYQFQKGKSSITLVVGHSGLVVYLALAGT